eukprot:g62111.t1
MWTFRHVLCRAGMWGLLCSLLCGGCGLPLVAAQGSLGLVAQRLEGGEDELLLLHQAQWLAAPPEMLRYSRGLPSDNSPVHFRLSFHSAADGSPGIAVVWETDSLTGQDVCFYGTSQHALNLSASGLPALLNELL